VRVAWRRRSSDLGRRIRPCVDIGVKTEEAAFHVGGQRDKRYAAYLTAEGGAPEREYLVDPSQEPGQAAEEAQVVRPRTRKNFRRKSCETGPGVIREAFMISS
jgi:hypothetical protein